MTRILAHLTTEGDWVRPVIQRLQHWNTLSPSLTITRRVARGVYQAVRLYRIGGIVSECLYSPGSGLKPPKDSPRPIGRINASMAVRGSTLWLMGGMLEIGDNEIALDDLWSLDLNKLDCWRCHRELTTLPDDLRPQVRKGVV